jgi:hypothetical protein
MRENVMERSSGDSIRFVASCRYTVSNLESECMKSTIKKSKFKLSSMINPVVSTKVI